MIHAYNEQFLPVIKNKLAQMFELAVNVENIEIDTFADLFVSSRVCRAFEKADPVLVMGKSANELLALILDKEPVNAIIGDEASPEYWAGWVLACAQWYFNTTYRELISALPCSKLVENYFPYHEMDITQSLDLYAGRLPRKSALKELRRKHGLSQTELALLSGVPERTIRSYEQGTNDISKAQAETLYALSQVLGCTIEDLITSIR